MPDPAHWSVFLGATLVLLLVPGPSVIYVLTQTVDHGYRGALLASIGLALGDFLQVLATVAGLSALLASSMASFQMLKYAGACYLVFLGVRRFLENDNRTTAAVGQGSLHERASSLVVRAFLALNPKTALFFFALFPQVVDLHAGSIWVQMLLFGTTFTVVGFVTNSLYGCVAGRLASRLIGDESLRSSARYATSGTLIGLGLITAVSH